MLFKSNFYCYVHFKLHYMCHILSIIPTNRIIQFSSYSVKYSVLLADAPVTTSYTCQLHLHEYLVAGCALGYDVTWPVVINTLSQRSCLYIPAD